MIYLVLFVFGLCFGSFVNALVWRVYKQEELEDKKPVNPKLHASNYSVLKGRSMCPYCEHTLGAKDLIPVLSWLALRGKCRYCKKPISYQYPLVELLTAVLFVGTYIFWPGGDLSQSEQFVPFVSWLVVLVGLIALAVYDAKWMILPNKILYPLTVFAIASLVLQALLFGTTISEITAIVLAVVAGCGFFGLIYFVSKGKWIGFGDVKLAILLGLLVATPLNMFITLFLSSVLGMLWIMPLMLAKKLKPTSHIPFGPFLIAACVTVVIFSANIIDLYRNLLLI